MVAIFLSLLSAIDSTWTGSKHLARDKFSSQISHTSLPVAATDLPSAIALEKFSRNRQVMAFFAKQKLRGCKNDGWDYSQPSFMYVVLW
jgi:hypothetical protein